MPLARSAAEDAGFDQAAHAFLEEQGVAFGDVDQGALDRIELRVPAEQLVEHLVCARRRQRIDPQLGKIAPARPSALILGAMIHEEEQFRRRDAFEQHIEEGLGLGVDPVQILADQEQGLHLAFA